MITESDLLHNSSYLLSQISQSINKYSAMIIACILCKRHLLFEKYRIRNANWYPRTCMWHVAHLIQLDNFFWLGNNLALLGSNVTSLWSHDMQHAKLRYRSLHECNVLSLLGWNQKAVLQADNVILYQSLKDNLSRWQNPFCDERV